MMEDAKDAMKADSKVSDSDDTTVERMVKWMADLTVVKTAGSKVVAKDVTMAVP